MSHTRKVNLVPENVELALYAGDGANLRITLRDSMAKAVPIDGAVKAQVRLHRDDLTALEDFSVDLSEGPQGIVRLALTGIQTNALLNGEDFSGFWDVQWTGVGDEPVTLVQGKVTCTRDVTR